MGADERSLTMHIEVGTSHELEALLETPAGTAEGVAVVAAPHPLYGGSLDNPVVSELANGLRGRGYQTLRFNWRGIGSSSGDVSGDLDDAEQDFAAVARHVASDHRTSLIAAGYSFGAATATRVALRDDRFTCLVLIAPPVALLAPLDLAGFDRPVRAIVGAEDSFAPTDQLERLLQPLENLRLEVVPGADHFFMQGGLASIAALVDSLL